MFSGKFSFLIQIHKNRRIALNLISSKNKKKLTSIATNNNKNFIDSDQFKKILSKIIRKDSNAKLELKKYVSSEYKSQTDSMILDYLMNQTIKPEFSPEEDKKIISYQIVHGSSWSKISKELNARSPSEIKYHFKNKLDNDFTLLKEIYEETDYDNTSNGLIELDPQNDKKSDFYEVGFPKNIGEKKVLIGPKKNGLPWSENEDKLLHKIFNLEMNPRIGKNLKYFPGRSYQSIRERLIRLNIYKKRLRYIKKGKWSQEEVEKFYEAINIYGVENWGLIVDHAKLSRTETQCNDFWFNHKNGNTKIKRWTKEELSRIESSIRAFQKLVILSNKLKDELKFDEPANNTNNMEKINQNDLNHNIVPSDEISQNNETSNKKIRLPRNSFFYISDYVKTRSPRQCYLKYLYLLNGYHSRGYWNLEDDIVVYKNYQKFYNNHEEMNKLLKKKRTPKSLELRFNRLHDQLVKLGIYSESNVQVSDKDIELARTRLNNIGKGFSFYNRKKNLSEPDIQT
ncbi:hypothetical protein BB558_001308 [Smittium angustum]|uniref:Myb-like domain-containing protein n=1 Tax=Smittium angustum TaxID=133377 RepID=A0A2U1JBU4_SMIAN|nr:hypothetical protein BB558_003949 [Smittium angustum]PWA02505.1 hypothetical protein BB558_001308 [Smittium angustum]